MLSPMDQTTEFLLYTAPGGKVAVEVFLHDENIWLPQTRIGELFGTTKQNVGQHLKNIFSDGELDEDSVVKEFFTTAADGKNYKTKYYNLDAIISVGYRVNSSKATQFRIWATERLREFIVKGFVLDDERLKNGRYFGKDYFRELLERVRSIRASERRIYQQITDIFAECSEDYDKNSEEAHLFYAHVQDKFHFAITGQTSSELIHQRADADKPWMGLQTYKNAPDGRVLLSDTKVGKNYLAEDEIKQLERTVSSFFDYIERIIESRTTFTMRAFADSVNRFLEFNEYKVLEGYGSISRKQADAKARSEYEKFNATQRIESDFDKAVKAIEAKKEGGE
jgi:hypothetical protein